MKTKNKTKKEKKLSFGDKYIRGHFHCNECPYYVSERQFEDCEDFTIGGMCYIKGEDFDSRCRILPPIKALIGPIKKKQYLYMASKIEGDYFKTIKEEEAKDLKMLELIENRLINESPFIEATKSSETDPYVETAYKESVLRAAYEIRTQYEKEIKQENFNAPLHRKWGLVFRDTALAIKDFFLAMAYKEDIVDDDDDIEDDT